MSNATGRAVRGRPECSMSNATGRAVRGRPECSVSNATGRAVRGRPEPPVRSVPLGSAVRGRPEPPLRSVSLGRLPVVALTPLRELQRAHGAGPAGLDGPEAQAERGPKRRAPEPPVYESPAKIFLRMKERAKQRRGGTSDVTRIPRTTDVILSPGNTDVARASSTSDVRLYPGSTEGLRAPRTTDVLRAPRTTDVLRGPRTTDVLRGPRTATDVLRAPRTATDVLRAPRTATDVLRAPRTATDVLRAPRTADGLRAPRSATDVILTPSFAQLRGPARPGHGAAGLRVPEPPVQESPQKFFLRIKQKLRQQQHEDPTPSNPIPQYIPPSTTAEKALVKPACADQLRNEPPEDEDNDEEDVDVFLLEPIDADDEQAENIVNGFLSVNSTPSKNEDQAKGKCGNGEAKHTEFHQDRRELQPSKKQAALGVEKSPESSSPKPSQCMCSLVLSPPTVHIPRMQKQAENPEVPLDKLPADQPAGKADKEPSICLSSWRIKVLEGNTGICVEGKRKAMRSVLWHSNAIAERVAHNQVRTCSGSVYLLEGRMDSAAMRKQGFPYRFIKRFMYGFSTRWKEYVQEFLEERRRKEEKQNSGVDEEGDSVVGAAVLGTTGGSRKKPEKRNTPYKALPKNNENAYTTPRRSSRGSDSSRVYTRSGRLVKPPLSFWCGQRAFVDQNLDVTIQEGGVDYLSLMFSSEKSPKETSRFSKKNKPKEVLKTTEEMPKSQNKGKGMETPASSQRESRPAREALPCGDGADPAPRATRTRSQPPATMASSSAKVPDRHRSSIPGMAKEKRGADSGKLPKYEQHSRYSLRSAKQPSADKHFHEESSDRDEGEESSEDIPLLIRRKNKSIFKPEPRNWKSCSDSERSWDDANKVSGEPGTRKASRNVPDRPSPPEASDRSEVPTEGNTSSAESSASHVSWKATRTRSRTSPPRYHHDSDTEPESSEKVKDRKVKDPGKKPRDGASSTAWAAAAKPREHKRGTRQNPLERLPRAADGWSEKELQKLYRQEVALC